MLRYNFHAYHKVLKNHFDRQNVLAFCLVETILKKMIFMVAAKIFFFVKILSDLLYFKPTVRENITTETNTPSFSKWKNITSHGSKYEKLFLEFFPPCWLPSVWLPLGLAGEMCSCRVSGLLGGVLLLLFLLAFMSWEAVCADMACMGWFSSRLRVAFPFPYLAALELSWFCQASLLAGGVCSSPAFAFFAGCLAGVLISVCAPLAAP